MSMMESREIKKYIPHRYPFLLVDRVITMEKYKSLVAIKNITANEPFFIGHFPVRPVMPGVLVIESLAQAAGILIVKSLDYLNTMRIFIFLLVLTMRVLSVSLSLETN